MRTLRTIREVGAALWSARQSDRRVGLVPTMGAFHEGHLSLMRAARSECDVVVVSLFVNPTQFGPDEDFNRYPRDEGEDARLAVEVGADLLFAPSVEEMYPPGFGASVDPGPVGTVLCGAHRPGHFEGVATVIARLFGICAPDVAYFGLKDYQQVVVVRRIVADLAIPIEIRAISTVRDADGLAVSSRNRYLVGGERARAARLYASLRSAEELYAFGERGKAVLVGAATAAAQEAGLDVEYVDLRDAETLGTYTPERAAVLAAAVHVGGTRLIDNVVLAPPLKPVGRPAALVSEEVLA
jgi:pantoate--beta-alanine ligase